MAAMTQLHGGDGFITVSTTTCGPASSAATTDTGSSDVDSLNMVTVCMVLIVLLLNVIDGVLDRAAVPYHFIWVGVPGALFLYAMGLPAWCVVVHYMRTGVLAR